MLILKPTNFQMQDQCDRYNAMFGVALLFCSKDKRQDTNGKTDWAQKWAPENVLDTVSKLVYMNRQKG